LLRGRTIKQDHALQQLDKHTLVKNGHFHVL